MTWLDLTENPKAVSSVFASVPSLDEVEVMSIRADREGPTIELTLALNEFPASPPQRWHREANTVALSLQLMGVESAELRGWTTMNRAKITIEPNQAGTIHVLATGTTLSFSAVCGSVRIAHISAYRREASA